MIKSELTTETIFFEEIKLKHFKKFLKDIYGDSIQEFHFLDVFHSFLSKILKKDKLWVERLGYLDLFCLMIDCRLSYGASTCHLSMMINDKKQNIELNLNKVRSYLLEISKSVESSFVHNNLKLSLGVPSYKRMPLYVEDIPFSFIKSITLLDNTIEITSNKQAQQLLEELSLDVFVLFSKQTEELWTKINDTNLFHGLPITEQLLLSPFNFSNLFWYVKLFFNEDLNVIYKNIFYLVYKGNFDAQFINNSTIGEYTYFVSCLLSELNPKETSSNVDVDDLEDLSDDIDF